MTRRFMVRAGADTPKMKVYDLDKMAERLEAFTADNTDAIIPASALTYHEDGTIEYEGTKFSLTDWSWSQLAQRVGMPTTYLRKAQRAGISRQHVDHWLADMGEKKLLLRFALMATADPRTGAEGRVRAILTDRMAPLSNKELFETVRPFIEQHDMSVQWADLRPDDSAFHFRLLFPEEVQIVVDGRVDPHRVGVHFANSEVGSRSLTGDMLVYREVCTNGLIALVEEDRVLHTRHSGDTGGLITKVRTALEVVRHRAGDIAGKLSEAVGRAVDAPLQMIEALMRTAGMPQTVVEKVQQAYQREPHATTFGIVQAITRAAQGMAPDRRVVMEELAGRLLAA